MSVKATMRYHGQDCLALCVKTGWHCGKCGKVLSLKSPRIKQKCFCCGAEVVSVETYTYDPKCRVAN